MTSVSRFLRFIIIFEEATKAKIVISSDFLMIANRILADSSIAVIEVRPGPITSFLAAFADRKSYKEF